MNLRRLIPLSYRKTKPIHFRSSMDTMLIHLHLWRIHTPRLFCFRPSLTLNRSTTLASSNAPTQASPPNTRYAVQYLVQSCGLSSDEALKASRHIKSPDNADAVICYLREIGLSDSDIRKVVLRDSRFLFSSLEKSLRPNITKLQEVGFSNEDISGIICASSAPIRFNIVSKIDFWMGVLESVENLSVVLKVWRGVLISSNLEKVIRPNISFLREHCDLSTRQFVRLIKSSPKLLSSKPEFVKRVVERAEELGIARSSKPDPKYFEKYRTEALIAVCYVSESSIDAKLNNLRNIGFSQEEVEVLIYKFPSLLTKSEKLLGRKMEFLMKEAGCDKLHVIQNPLLLTFSLENRLIPRNTVRKLLMSKGLSVANLSFATFAMPSDKKFVKKFVLPYEPAILGLHQAFADAGTIEGINQL